MIMITGGAFQGKREFAKSRFFLTDAEILDCGTCAVSDIAKARCVCSYELAVKRLTAENIDPLGFTERLGCEIVIMNEIGCGIIPLDRGEREWRELTGRAGCIIAERADTVYRVCCGIVSVIKGNDEQ